MQATTLWRIPDPSTTIQSTHTVRLEKLKVESGRRRGDTGRRHEQNWGADVPINNKVHDAGYVLRFCFL